MTSIIIQHNKYDFHYHATRYIWLPLSCYTINMTSIIILIDWLIYYIHHVRPSVRPSVCRQILCRTITWVVYLGKFYQLFTGEERRVPFFFDDFHFCRSRVIGLDMTENRIFTLCRMITWVVFLRLFRNWTIIILHNT
jgi:hypothetical protein